MTEFDIASLAQQVTTFLAPFLPYLIKTASTIGKEAVKEVGEKAGGFGWDRAVKLWEHIKHPIETRPSAMEAVQDAASNPDDTRITGALSWQLEKVLGDLPTEQLSKIKDILTEAKIENRTTVASGERSVAIGGNVDSSTIITGNKNKVSHSD